MTLESFIITPKSDQGIEAILSFGRGLMARRIANGCTKIDGKVVVYLWPRTAAKYTMQSAAGVGNYDEDKAAVLSALLASGYVPDGEEAPSEQTAPAPAPKSARVQLPKGALRTPEPASGDAGDGGGSAEPDSPADSVDSVPER